MECAAVFHCFVPFDRHSICHMPSWSRHRQSSWAEQFNVETFGLLTKSGYAPNVLRHNRCFIFARLLIRFIRININILGGSPVWSTKHHRSSSSLWVNVEDKVSWADCPPNASCCICWEIHRRWYSAGCGSRRWLILFVAKTISKGIFVPKTTNQQGWDMRKYERKSYASFL